MVHFKQKPNQEGFTLIEILLVIAILAVLAGVVVLAINPNRQLTVARDSERKSEVYAIISAIHQYALDNESSFPALITDEPLEICRTGSESCVGKYDLSVLTDDEAYLVSMPVDPICEPAETECSESDTGYVLSLTETGRILVTAAHAELQEISVTK
jgi:type IV pilus assembly protein PilA